MNERINLIPGYRIAARRRVRAVSLWLRGGMCYVLALVCGVVFFQTQWAGDTQDLEASLRQAAQRLENMQSEQVILQEDLASGQRRLDANYAVNNQPDYSVLLALMARTLDEHVVLRSFAFEAISLDQQAKSGITEASDPPKKQTRPKGFDVHASGYARSQKAVASYVLRLEQIELFHEVRLISTRREPVQFGDGDAIAFEVRCFLKADAHHDQEER